MEKLSNKAYVKSLREREFFLPAKMCDMFVNHITRMGEDMLVPACWIVPLTIPKKIHNPVLEIIDFMAQSENEAAKNLAANLTLFSGDIHYWALNMLNYHSFGIIGQIIIDMERHKNFSLEYKHDFGNANGIKYFSTTAMFKKSFNKKKDKDYNFNMMTNVAVRSPEFEEEKWIRQNVREVNLINGKKMPPKEPDFVVCLWVEHIILCPQFKDQNILELDDVEDIEAAKVFQTVSSRLYGIPFYADLNHFTLEGKQVLQPMTMNLDLNEMMNVAAYHESFKPFIEKFIAEYGGKKDDHASRSVKALDKRKAFYKKMTERK